MLRTFKALCIRECAQDANDELSRPFMHYREGKTYNIREDSPVLIHFRPLEELPPKEADRVAAEGELERPLDRPARREYKNAYEQNEPVRKKRA